MNKKELKKCLEVKRRREMRLWSGERERSDEILLRELAEWFPVWECGICYHKLSTIYLHTILTYKLKSIPKSFFRPYE